MNITETTTEGLRRQLKVVIGADELERRLSARLDELKSKARLKGFRPGRVPKEHLRKIFGRSVMAEVVQQAVAETSRAALSQRDERPAFQPTVGLPESEAEIDGVFAGKSDLAYTLSFEVIIDFTGSIAGKPFEGGAAEDAPVVLGSDNFIPGFEEGLKGARAGDSREIDVTFPDDYPEARLAGKAAQFVVKVKDVGAPETPPLDDEFAKSLGIESVDALRDTVKQRLEQDRAAASRLKVKRALLDALSEGHKFELPPTLVDNEFKTIWDQVTADLERSKHSFEDEGTTEEKAREEYRELAARRVRLGLVLSEVGNRNQIAVSEDEINRALLERVRQFPGQERKVYDHYRNNPDLLAEFKAPIFEDKTVDFILELAKVTEQKVSPEQLYADHDGDHDHDHDHDHSHDHGPRRRGKKRAKKRG
jgi:trigger factor